jgi:peptide/nickel transport system substrate-binding protein
MYLGLNQKRPILAKPQVREALKYLVDYRAIEANLLKGTRIVHQGFLPEGYLGAIKDEPYKLDIPRAKSLLAAAGLPDGFSITMDVRNVSPFTDVAQAIQASFAQAGVKLDLIPGDGKQTLTKYRARNHDIYIGDWGSDYPDPHSNAEAFATNPDNGDDAKAKTLAWRNAWDIPDFNQLSFQALIERNPERRRSLYEALQRRHQAEAPFVVMFEQVEVAAHRAEVDGLVLGPLNLLAGISKH